MAPRARDGEAKIESVDSCVAALPFTGSLGADADRRQAEARKDA